MLHQIISETGWSLHYVLWKVSRANILLMLADRSNVKSVKASEKVGSGKDLINKYKRKS